MNPAVKTYPEQNCLKEVALGNRAAFQQLYDQYHGRVFYCALHFTKSAFDADDICQEVFFKIWQHRQRIGFIEHFTAYILTLTRNKCLNWLKKNQRDLRGKNRYATRTVHCISEVEEKLLCKEIKKIWLQAVEQLPVRQKEAYLFMEEGLNRDETARMMEVSAHTIREQRQRARKTVQLYLNRRLDTGYSNKNKAA